MFYEIGEHRFVKNHHQPFRAPKIIESRELASTASLSLSSVDSPTSKVKFGRTRGKSMDVGGSTKMLNNERNREQNETASTNGIFVLYGNLFETKLKCKCESRKVLNNSFGLVCVKWIILNPQKRLLEARFSGEWQIRPV